MPTQAKWAIRFYLPFDDSDSSLTFVGSFNNAGARYHDDVTVFSGMYGTPDFMLWYIHKDLETYDFSLYSLDLKLYATGKIDYCYFQDQYRVVSVSDDPNSDRKVLFAIQEEYAILRSLLFDAEVYSLPYDETRGPIELLKEVLMKTGLLPVVYQEHFDENKKSFKYEYPTFAFEPDWTIYDFIDYVARENGLEWTVKFGCLFIGPELWTWDELNATDPLNDKTVLKIAKTPFVTKIYSHGMGVDVLYYYEWTDGEKMVPLRCVWVRHTVGAKGDTTTACFVKIGEKCTRDIYVDSLDGDKEIEMSHMVFTKKRLYKQIKIGAIYEDQGEEYTSEYAEKITFEKDPENWSKKTPRKRILNTTEPSYILHKIGRTSPYFGCGEGILFPSPETPANFVLLAPDDRIENSVIGPFTMGDGSEEFIIIKKNAGDFRMSFGNGWTLYVDEDGNTIMQTDGMDPEAVPTKDTSKTHIQLNKDGTIDINTNNKEVTINQGTIAVSTENHKHSIGTHTHQVSPGPAIPGPPIVAAPDSTGQTDADPDKNSALFRVNE